MYCAWAEEDSCCVDSVAYRICITRITLFLNHSFVEWSRESHKKIKTFTSSQSQYAFGHNAKRSFVMCIGKYTREWQNTSLSFFR